jgi:DNA invertase Pin-like site-specific DNA recombinase
MRYVIYRRVSTEQQADAGQGIELQDEACRRWLRANRHRNAGTCTDSGKSGAAEIGERAGLARALALLAEDKADGILVFRLDRLARDVVLQETLLADLHRQGKELRSCSAAEDEHLTHDPSDPTRALVRRILGSVAAYERDMIRLRLRAGQTRKRANGGYIGGGVPYGWTSVRGELVEVPAEQEVIRLIAKLRRQGMPLRQIGAHLESRGIPSRAPHGNWRPTTVLRIAERAGVPTEGLRMAS